jgi:hypothetical protein
VKWLLKYRCDETVVHNAERTVAMRNIGDFLQLRDFQQWIRQRLHPHQFRIRSEGRPH